MVEFTFNEQQILLETLFFKDLELEISLFPKKEKSDLRQKF